MCRQVGGLKAQAHKLTDEAAGEKVRLLQALHDGEQLRSRIVEVRCILQIGLGVPTLHSAAFA